MTSENSRHARQPKATKPYRGVDAAHRIDAPQEVFIRRPARKPPEPLVDERIPSPPPLPDISSGPHGDDPSPLDLYGTPILIDEPNRS